MVGYQCVEVSSLRVERSNKSLHRNNTSTKFDRRNDRCLLRLSSVFENLAMRIQNVRLVFTITLYRPYELSLLFEVYAYKISHSVRDFMPNCTTSFSPFAVRVRPGKRREQTGNKNLNMKNPSMTGQSSTSSTTSSASSSEDLSSEEDESHQHTNESQLITSKESLEFTSFESLFPSMKEVYGTQPEYPKRNDVVLYKKFVLIGRNATYLDYKKLRSKLIQESSFPETVTPVIKLPVVTEHSINIYEQYVKRAYVGGSLPNSSDINLYENYTKQAATTVAAAAI